jgi:multicomponent Na+:H+ antiporter subunit A
MLAALLIAHGVVGLGVLGAARRLGRAGIVLGGLVPLASIVWIGLRSGSVLDGSVIEETYRWVPGLDLSLDLGLDGFGVLMAVLVSGIGTLVFVYAWSYFGRSEKAGRAAGLLTLFAGAMLGVVLADNLLLLYLCWELTSVTSYLLIGLDDKDPNARASALHALLVTTLGGLAMLGGFVVVGQAAGSYRISEIVANPPTGAAVSGALICVLLGAFTKSAQYPFHSWLPGAMVAPTPISAYLHSAAMVKAGVVLVARLAPGLAPVGAWRPVVIVVALVTMIAGGLRALRAVDLKQILAFGTISQLGLMMLTVGIGQPKATAAGVGLILAHAIFKAPLFMVVGIVDHETGTRDPHELPRLGAGWVAVKAVTIVSAASMAAVPGLAAFIVKEKALEALADGGVGLKVALAGVVVSSALTVAYTLRFAAAVLAPDLIAPIATVREVNDHGPPPEFVAPAVVLSAASVILGVGTGLWSGLIDGAAKALDPTSGAKLKLWHGVNLPLILSMSALAGGALLFAGRRAMATLQARCAPPVDGTTVYERCREGLLRLAARVTSVVQPGSLPIYLAVILSTAAVVPLVGLLRGTWWPASSPVLGRWVHVPIALLLVASAVASAFARRRFAAALLLGATGYGMALLFVVQGAPDLALTQFAVETLSVVLFLLVLRRLPDRFEIRPQAIWRPLRLLVSALVGVLVVVMALTASGWRTETPISGEMSRRALSEGDGRNVVNVILVDIRGLDTLGEITVLVAAGIGIVSLARAGRWPRRAAANGGGAES